MSALECVAGVLALFGLPGGLGALDVSAATNIYVRGQEAAAATVLNGDVVPRLAARVEWPVAELNLGYAPRLTLARIVGPADPSFYLLHAGDASLKVDTPRYRLDLGQTFAIGELFIGNLIAPTTPGAGASMSATPTMPGLPAFTLLPAAESIHVRNQDSRASLRYLITRRLSSTTAASYTILGGYGERSQLLQPRQHTTQLTQTLGYMAKERHELSTSVWGSHIDFSNGFEHWIASASEMWMAQWSEAVTTGLELGVAWRRSMNPDDRIIYNVMPNATATLNYASIVEYSNLNVQLRTGINPNANVLTGDLQTFTLSTISVSLRRDDVSATLSSNLAQTLPIHDSGATRAFGATVEFAWSTSTWLDLTFGGRCQKQYLSSGAAPFPLQWVATLGVLATTERLRR